VAQDLSDPTLTNRNKPGWPFIWDRVMGWHNDTFVVMQPWTDDPRGIYNGGINYEMGHAFDGWMELESKSRALILIAILFFIAYWVIAGPGLFVYLLAKTRAHWSWFMYGASAIAATLFTVMVVKLVVRGDPELSHVTLVRVMPAGQPTLMLSRFGLYVPADGYRDITLRENVINHVSTITAFPVHPSQTVGDIPYPAKVPYIVPIREAAADSAVGISVPIRSTLKKFQACYVANQTEAIDGTAKLRESDSGTTFDGLLTNNASCNLKNVYFVYHNPTSEDDYVCFTPNWSKGKSINLNEQFSYRNAKQISTEADARRGDSTLSGVPEQHVNVIGPMGTKPGISNGWTQYWYAGKMRSAAGNLATNQLDDKNAEVPHSFPLLSLFGRLPPVMRGDQLGDHVELFRRGSRDWDVSSAVAGGSLVVLAQSDGEVPLPFPLEVDGKKVGGNGVVFYQFVLPLAHEKTAASADNATTQPVGTSSNHSDALSAAPTHTRGD
jgi:hypothetical protein